jgi:pyruvate,water dikinase
VELDITTPRWREDPTFLLQSVTNYLRHPAGTPTPPEMLAEGTRRREAAAAVIRERLPFPVRGLFDRLYARYVLWLPFREAMKYTWLLALEQARRVYRELGRRLAEAGHLKTMDDVFWLRLVEVREWAESGTVRWSRELLEQREREWETWNRLRPPSLIVGTRGLDEVPSTPSPQQAAILLRGTPASTGQAEGIARVITDPHQANLRPGEILVTRYTDPAWTPLFFTAGALITEVGGVLSHGAVVAREIGLPAIVGVEGATSLIATGRRVRVNATEGTVELL